MEGYSIWLPLAHWKRFYNIKAAVIYFDFEVVTASDNVCRQLFKEEIIIHIEVSMPKYDSVC